MVLERTSKIRNAARYDEYIKICVSMLVINCKLF